MKKIFLFTFLVLSRLVFAEEFVSYQVASCQASQLDKNIVVFTDDRGNYFLNLFDSVYKIKHDGQPPNHIFGNQHLALHLNETQLYSGQLYFKTEQGIALIDDLDCEYYGITYIIIPDTTEPIEDDPDCVGGGVTVGNGPQYLLEVEVIYENLVTPPLNIAKIVDISVFKQGLIFP